MDGMLANKINTAYESAMFGEEREAVFRRYDKIGFFNVGYWKGVEDSIEVAQLNLIETLISFFPDREGTILDVACGKGASSKYLTKYFDPKRVTGINISDAQLDLCKLIAPECNFILMDAADLKFPNSSFDNVLCIEAALHFMTRYRFFEEVHRVLKPGGRLAMLDFLCNYDLLDEFYAGVLPKENYLPDLNAYNSDLLKVGFKHVRVEECTELTVKAAERYVIRMEEKEFGRKPDVKVLENISQAKRFLAAFSPGCMVYAIK